jgi:hypothetical protein
MTLRRRKRTFTALCSPSIRVVVAATTATMLCSPAVMAESMVTFQGLGPVRIGMTAVAAEQALGARLKKLDGISEDDEKSCWIGRRADGVDPELTYMFERGKVTRIDVSGSTKGAARAIKTPKGIGINATENEIRQAYGCQIAVTINTDAGEGVVWMTLNSSDKGRGMTFALYKGKVTSFWTALYPAITYYEGCL